VFFGWSISGLYLLQLVCTISFLDPSLPAIDHFGAERSDYVGCNGQHSELLSHKVISAIFSDLAAPKIFLVVFALLYHLIGFPTLINIFVVICCSFAAPLSPALFTAVCAVGYL